MNKEKILFSITTLICLFSISEGATVRIVNGTNADEGEFPFAAVLRKYNSLTCGSTILNEKFILTAAHCVCFNNIPQNATWFSIQYGLTTNTLDDTNIIQVKKIHCNAFSMMELTFDSAVLELEERLPANGNWSVVTIAKTLDTSKERNGVIIGWGRLEQDGALPSTLQKLNVNVYDDSLCSSHYNIEHHICFGSDYGGACNGDSGTALLIDGVQAGIASFINAKCGIANKDYPNVYSRIPKYFNWIKGIAGDVKFADL